MKIRIVWVLLFGVLVLASSAAASDPNDPPESFDPPKVPVHPVLEEQYLSFFPPEVLKVTDGVYVARGYNRDNPALIVGSDGLIVVDPGESIAAGQAAKNAFDDHPDLKGIFEKKPVKAIIYTHHHDCHINGASVFADKHTEIIAHEKLMASLFNEWFGQVYPSRAQGGAKMSGFLFLDDPGWYAGYVLAGPQIFGPQGFLAPTRTVKDELKRTVAGVRLRLISAPGEAGDVIVVWLPDKEVLLEIGLLYQAFPALVTMRGSGQRNPLDYINSLKICRDLEPAYMVALHGGTPVTKGKKEVRQLLTDFSDAIQFVHDQTVQYMNKGLEPGEIKDLIELPPHLADRPYLQQTYGRVDWDVYHIFRYYRGYYTDRVRDLIPQSPASEAQMAAELAGSIEALATKAEETFHKGDEACKSGGDDCESKLQWALKLADYVLLLEPENGGALETKKAAMLALAENTMNSQARNMLLSDYLLLTGQLPPELALLLKNPLPYFSRINDYYTSLMPMDAALRIMAVNLDASKSVDEDMVVGLELTDLERRNKYYNSPDPFRYSLHVRKGILESEPWAPKKAEFKIVTDSLTWKELVLGKLRPDAAVSAAKVVIAGAGPEDFYFFMSLFANQSFL